MPDLIVEDLSFSDALERSEWHGVDYVIIDLSHRVDDDPNADEYPSIEVARHILELAPGRGPYLVVITGDSGAYHEPMVMRRLVEENVEYFLHRQMLVEHLDELFAEPGPTGLPKLEPSEDILAPGDGVTRRSRVNEAVAVLKGQKIATEQPRGGTGQARRRHAQGAGNLEAVRSDGTIDPGVPHYQELLRFYERAARLPRKLTRSPSKRRDST